MPGPGLRVTHRTWSIGSARFMRDVFASVLATGVATVAFSHLTHEPTPPARQAASKHPNRLTWEQEEVPTRVTRTYDSLAMFALPRVDATAWSEPSSHAGLPRVEATLRSAQIERRDEPPRKLAVRPPSRPVPASGTLDAISPGPAQAAIVADAGPPRGGLHVFGWRVPGSDLVASVRVPDGRDALNRIAALGDEVVVAGSALAETVGLR